MNNYFQTCKTDYEALNIVIDEWCDSMCGWPSAQGIYRIGMYRIIRGKE